MKIKGAAAALSRAVQQKVGGAAHAGRGLTEGEARLDGARPGRSEIAYMQQHKYTPLDVRIIIITAAILLLLLCILFLNFFIRWALRRFFPLPSQMPINPNKGLSKRQVQALPSFIYSSSKPHATPPCHHPKFYHDLLPITFHGDNNFGHHLNPPTKIGSTKVDEFYNISPPTKSKVDEVDQKPPSPLGSTKLDEVDNDPPTKFGSLEVDEVIEGNNPILGSTKANVPTIDCEVKANSPTFKSGNPILGCTKVDEMSNCGDDNASSPAPCPICLVDYRDGDTIRVLPTCRHYFHIGCIDMWLAKNSSCPACRANILEATRTPINQPTLQVQVIITSSH